VGVLLFFKGTSPAKRTMRLPHIFSKHDWTNFIIAEKAKFVNIIIASKVKCFNIKSGFLIVLGRPF
jgi:hypothetical protein